MKKILIIMTILLTVLAASCGHGEKMPAATENPGNTEVPQPTAFDPAEYEFSETDGAYGGIDALGRELTIDDFTYPERDRKVGIFYFLWLGEHGTEGPYDNNKIVAGDPAAVNSPENWIAAGGGAPGVQHFWGEPLFGYYKSSDKWVMRKHCQMLTDAGVDFVMFDVTNGHTYLSNVKNLIKVWYEYLEAGYDVPKLAFFTNTSSGYTINLLYKGIYNSEQLHKKYPRLDELWFCMDGKPMVAGNPDDARLSEEVKDYFCIKTTIWPTQSRESIKNADNGFSWMEFSRLLTDDAVYGRDGRKEMVNVSIAQHCQTICMSATAWYGANDHSRSWHDGANDKSPDAVLWGYNFNEQWEWARKVDPEMVFITGWNEWAAQRQSPWSEKNGAIAFVDCADPNTSRDAEPMRGLFGDNYYLQMIDNIRKYKGVAPRVDVGSDVTIDTSGDFSQWDNVTARYTDYPNDTVNRSEKGFGNIVYKDESGRNDFVEIRAAKNSENCYFYVKTSEAITPSDEENRMTLFINSGSLATEKWEKQFDFAVNLHGEGVVSQYKNGKWEDIGNVSCKAEGNQMMFALSRKLLGNYNDIINMQFKFADNYLTDENGAVDIYSFYTSGDAAPIGRETYVFSEFAFK